MYIFLLLESVLLCGKHIINRRILHFMRSRGYNQKYVILAGCGVTARRCFQELRNSPELGYQVVGYVSSLEDWPELPYLGSFTDIEVLLEKYKPDEFIAALDDEHTDVGYLAQACEASGTRFFLVPYYVQFFSNRPQVDSLNGIPMFSLRRIPLDNMVNAFIKRTFDVIGSLLLIVLTSPLMLAVAIGVKLSSPGPVLFRQKRIGYGSKPFTMYKFRSMRLNLQEDTAWSQNSDDGLEAPADFALPRPAHLEQMLEYSRRLAAPFPYVRADFYETKEKLVFGELTFTPAGALDTGRLPETDRMFGKLLELS